MDGAKFIALNWLKKKTQTNKNLYAYALSCVYVYGKKKEDRPIT